MALNTKPNKTVSRPMKDDVNVLNFIAVLERRELESFHVFILGKGHLKNKQIPDVVSTACLSMQFICKLL